MTQTYDAFVLDLMMPVMNGIEVINHLEQAAPKGLTQCVVVLTAASNRDLAKIQGKPVYPIIRKPFDMGELVNTIRGCIDEKASSATSRSD
jgi:CheY-like chemotaxis protein